MNQQPAKVQRAEGRVAVARRKSLALAFLYQWFTICYHEPSSQQAVQGSSHMESIELCAGAGGQALGLEQAGFRHQALVEIDAPCRATLNLNRPGWNVVEGDSADVAQFSATPYRGIDLLAGGLPCPPFSVAGKQLGRHDERNLFPEALRIIDECRPRAVLIENVRGFLDAVFSDYRQHLKFELKRMGYEADWRLFNASDFGVPQLRPRVMIVAIRSEWRDHFHWPEALDRRPQTVGQTLSDLMAANGWPGAQAWAGNCPNDCWRLEETRRSRPWPDKSARGLGDPWRRWQDPGRCRAASRFRRQAAFDGADGGAVAGLSRRLGDQRPQDRRLPSGRQRLPAADGQGGRGAAVTGLGWSAHLPGAGAWLRRVGVARGRGSGCIFWPISGG